MECHQDLPNRAAFIIRGVKTRRGMFVLSGDRIGLMIFVLRQLKTYAVLLTFSSTTNIVDIYAMTGVEVSKNLSIKELFIK